MWRESMALDCIIGIREVKREITFSQQVECGDSQSPNVKFVRDYILILFRGLIKSCTPLDLTVSRAPILLGATEIA